MKQLYGCDIDTHAFGHLSKVFEHPVDLSRFHEGDFLDQEFGASWPRKFDAVVGNPPYLPYRKIPVDKRERVLEQLREFGLELDRRASLWAYFCALGVIYTKAGGRKAWVLPSSFLYANYSRSLRAFIAGSFGDVRAFELKERQFLLEGTEEKTVVLLCRNRLSSKKHACKSDIPLTRCNGVKDLKVAIADWDKGLAQHSSLCGSSVFDALSDSPRRLMEYLRQDESCRTLGNFLGVKIGLVTGNNAFFTLSEADRRKHDLQLAELRKVMPRFQFAAGVDFKPEDHECLIEQGAKGHLVSVTDTEEASSAMRSYLEEYSEEDISKCSTFKKRSIWSQTEDNAPPDAFFPVMQHHGPRLVLNSTSINCTNSVHRAYFFEHVSKSERQLLCLSLLSTFSQISAEACGRSYGSGALKHEPREAEKIEVLMPQLHPNTIRAAFSRVDRMLRDGNLEEARQFADDLIMKGLGEEGIPENIALLRSGLEQLKHHRHR